MKYTLAQLLKKHRKLAGLTQAQLATLAGLGKTAIFDIEHGKHTIQLDTLQKILYVLNIKLLCRTPAVGEIVEID